MLNACEGARGDKRDLFSSTAATLARRGLPAVLAMQYDITDRAAVEYTRTFYEALADQLPVDAALAEARAAIHLSINNSLEWGTPVLYLRAPDGVLFDLVGQAPVSAPVAERPESRPVPTLPSATPHAGEQESEGQVRERLEAVRREAEHREVSIPLGTLLATLSGHADAVEAVAWSPDGTLLVSASKDHTVRLWGRVNGQALATLSGHADAVEAVAWSPDGRYLASVSLDETVRLWDTTTRQALATLSGHTSPVMAVAWSPDGRYLASASYDNTVRLWDTTTRQALATLSGHTSPVQAVAWSPDGRYLASASADKTVRLWDTTTRQALATLSGHTSFVMGIAWSLDGRYLASADYSGTVRLWDATTRQALATLNGHTHGVMDVAWYSIVVTWPLPAMMALCACGMRLPGRRSPP